MRTRILLFVLILTAVQALAQQGVNPTQNKIKWVASSFTDLTSNSAVGKSAVFITDILGGKVRWIQKNGSLTYTLTISGIVGAWNNIENDGTATFNLNWEGKSGVLNATRKNGSLYLTLDINPSGKDRIYLRYDVSNYEVN
jgi:hypothetical protein